MAIETSVGMGLTPEIMRPHIIDRLKRAQIRGRTLLRTIQEGGVKNGVDNREILFQGIVETLRTCRQNISELCRSTESDGKSQSTLERLDDIINRAERMINSNEQTTEYFDELLTEIDTLANELEQLRS